MSTPPPTALSELLDLAPAALAERLQSLAGDFELAYAKNTQRTWRADWRVWSAFCDRQNLPALPATVESLRAFLTDRIDAGRRRATLEHYLATLGLAHRLASLPWPLDTLEGRLMWRGLRRTRLKARQRQAQGLTLELLATIVAPLGDEDPREIRDRALLCLAYETMARRSELVALEVEHLTREGDGSGRLLLERAKADQEGEGVVLFVSADTMACVDRWLAQAGHTSGALFRSIPHIAKGAVPASSADGHYPNPLDSGDVARIFKRRARAVGIDATLISGHSTRVGATQDLLAENFSAAAVMKQGRWKSERMVMRYGENIAAGRGAMAQLLKRRASSV